MALGFEHLFDCDSCYSNEVTVDIRNVVHKGERMVFTCRECGNAWIATTSEFRGG